VIVISRCTQRIQHRRGFVKSVNQSGVKPVYTPPHFKPQKLIFFEKTIENPPFLGLWEPLSGALC
ncbi:hypothetical protein ACQFZR_003363, partial [Raoultella ornithinolytica]